MKLRIQKSRLPIKAKNKSIILGLFTCSIRANFSKILDKAMGKIISVQKQILIFIEDNILMTRLKAVEFIFSTVTLKKTKIRYFTLEISQKVWLAALAKWFSKTAQFIRAHL